MKLLRYVGRFFAMGAIVSYFLTIYLAGRARRWFIRDRNARRSAVAHWKGAILRRTMAALGACFVKLGQVLSTRPDLIDPEIIDELRQLQDRLPAFPMRQVRRIIEEDLGATLEERYREFDPTPVAAASVAQVHRARLPDGEEVAVKVLRPDVRNNVERDAAILMTFAKMVNWHPTWRLSDPVGHLRHFIAGILDQTNLRLELAHYDLFRKHFEDETGVRFPHVHVELSAERVLTMEFLRGTKVDALPDGDHSSLASRLQKVVLKMCFVDGFVHADLHPGNILISPEGDIVIFDAGLVKNLSEEILLQFMDFTKCIAMGNAKDFVNHIRKFHTYMEGVNWEALEGDVTTFVERFRKQNVAQLEMGELFNDVFALGRKYRVHPLPDMALILIGLVTAEGIGKQLNPHNNLFHDTAAYITPLLAKKGLTLVG